MENTLVLEFLRKRDVNNFLQLRNAHPGDDYAVGELLVRSFRETYSSKLPSALGTEDRDRELRNVAAKRSQGLVRVLEFGYRIIGTYSLLHPTAELSEAWVPNTATLRCLVIDPQFHSLKLSERLLNDAVHQAGRWKAEHICLHVQNGAKGVAKIYEKFGFQRDQRGDKLCFGKAIEGYLLPLNMEVL